MTLPYRVKTKPIVVDFILSIMEVEALFLAEHSHFPRIDPAIIVPAIIAQLGFDPSNDDMQLRLTPAADLNDCYAIGGKSYEKGAAATCDVLDYAEVYLSLVSRFPELKRLCDILEDFVTS
jgi:hypothetical protein